MADDLGWRVYVTSPYPHKAIDCTCFRTAAESEREAYNMGRFAKLLRPDDMVDVGYPDGHCHEISKDDVQASLGETR